MNTNAVEPLVADHRHRDWLVVTGALIFAAGWQIPDYIVRIANSGHYQFLLLLPVVIVALLVIRQPEMRVAATQPNLVVFLVVIASIALLILTGHLLSSHLVGSIGWLAMVPLTIYTAYGSGGIRQVSGVLLLLLFAVRLPLSFDEKLIFEMQFIASSLASRLLDGIGVVHFREGIILVTQSSQFLTAEACSGVRSLFSSLAVVATFSVALRHHWQRVTVNLVQTFFWVLIGNALRVALVVALVEEGWTWVASGLGHEMLGIAVFAFILTMVGSTDACLHDHMPESYDPPVETDVLPINPSVPPFPFGRRAYRFAFVLFCVIGLVGLRVAHVRSGFGFGIASDLSASLASRLPPSQANHLPEGVAGFQQVSFEHVHRGEDFLQAEDSYIWTFRRDGLKASLSVDCPWAQWHNLNICYRGLGWQSEPQYFLTVDGERLSYSELNMTKQDGGRHGFVLFGAVDRTGDDVMGTDWRLAGSRVAELPTILFREAIQSLGFSGDVRNDVSPERLPASTIQLIAESRRPFTDAEKDAFRRLYFASRQQLLQSPRWDHGN